MPWPVPSGNLYSPPVAVSASSSSTCEIAGDVDRRRTGVERTPSAIPQLVQLVLFLADEPADERAAAEGERRHARRLRACARQRSRPAPEVHEARYAADRRANERKNVPA